MNKGALATLSGDVENLDGAGFTLTVNWGLYEGSDTIVYPAGTTSFSLTHQYVDDALDNFENVAFPIQINVTSADNRTAPTVNATVTGTDVAPAVNITGTVGIVGYNPPQPIDLSAVVADPGEYGTTFTYSWTATDQSGMDTQSQTSSSPTFSFTPKDLDGYTVSLKVTDSDGTSRQAQPLSIPFNGLSGSSGGWEVDPWQPDNPTVTIAECDANGTLDSSPVLAGTPAYFKVSVAGNTPQQGAVNVFYNTQNGSAVADTDYTGTDGQQELTFTWDRSANEDEGGYDPWIVQVGTSEASNGGTVSLVIPCLYDANASTTANVPGTPAASETATIDCLTINALTMNFDYTTGSDDPGAFLNEPDKATIGAWVPLNNVDDGYHFIGRTNTPMPDETWLQNPQHTIAQEEDLLPIVITATPVDAASLVFNAAVVKVFTTAEGGAQVASGTVLDLGALAHYTGPESTPDSYELWVEGYSVTPAGTSSSFVTLQSGLRSKVSDKIKVNVFSWSGPQDVPDYATYTYMAAGGQPGDSGWAPAYNGIMQKMDYRVRVGNVSYHAEDILWNQGGGDAPAQAVYMASQDYKWGFAVNVVKVVVSAGANSITGSNHGMVANLDVTFTGPTIGGVQRGVRFMEAGFIQTLKFTKQEAFFASDNTPNAASGWFRQCVNGSTTKTLQGNRFLDIETMTRRSQLPWLDYYNVGNSEVGGISIFTGNATSDGGVPTQNFKTRDVPASATPPANPVNLPRPNGGEATCRPQMVDSVWNFNLFFAVRTTAAVNGSQNLYVPRALAQWTYTRTKSYANPETSFSATGTTFTELKGGTAINFATLYPNITNPTHPLDGLVVANDAMNTGIVGRADAGQPTQYSTMNTTWIQ